MNHGYKSHQKLQLKWNHTFLAGQANSGAWCQTDDNDDFCPNNVYKLDSMTGPTKSYLVYSSLGRYC